MKHMEMFGFHAAVLLFVLLVRVEGLAVSTTSTPQPNSVPSLGWNWQRPCSGGLPASVSDQPTLETRASCRIDGELVELRKKTQRLINRVNNFKNDYIEKRLDNEKVKELTSFRHGEIPDIPIMEGQTELRSVIAITYKLLSYSIVLTGRAMKYEDELEPDSLASNFQELMTDMSDILCRLQLILRCDGKEHDLDHILSSETVQAIRSISSGYPDLKTRHELDYLLLRSIDEQADHLRQWLNDIHITVTVGRRTKL